MRLISQLINGISILLQKLLRYFNGTIISTFFVPIILCFTCYFLSLYEILLPGKLSATSKLVKGGSSL